MIVNVITKYQIKTNVKTLLSYRNKNVSTTTRMNMDDNLNKEVLDERNQQESLAIPGKIKLAENEIIEREKKLKSLAEAWKRERIIKEEAYNQFLGFTKNSEILNGRLAMFFLTTGLLTEVWTKETMIDQIDTMLRIVGIF